MGARPMTASGPTLTQREDCSRHGDWDYRWQEANVIPLIRDASVRAVHRTGSVRAESIRPIEASTFRAENITFEVTRRLVEQPWFDDVLATVRELLALGRNWDGSNEQAIHPKAIKRAMHILRTVGEEGPRPDLVPLPNGSVQLEWVYRNQEVKIESPPFGLVSVSICDPLVGKTEVRAGNQSKIWHELKDRLAIGTVDVKRWAKAAIERAVVEEPNEERSHYIATVPSCPGVLASGDSLDAALAELESVMFGWAHLKLRDGDSDIPPMGGIDLVNTT